MKTAHFVLLVFLVSFICAYTASYAADDAILKNIAVSGMRTVTDYNRLYYHNRGIDWQKEQPDTRKIQLRLQELGYNCGQIDGVLGPQTTQAIKALQKDKRLEVDGIVGPATCKALFKN